MFADETAGRREWVVLADQLDGVCIAAFSYQGNITWNVHMGRTEGYARNRLGNSAAASFVADMCLKIITAGMYHMEREVSSIRSSIS